MKTTFNVCQQAIIAMLLLFSFSIKTDAFNYTITFTGSQASTSVASVEVQNLTKGTTITVPEGNTLSLSDVLSGIETVNATSNGISIYPNPMQSKSTLSFFAPQAGNTQINVFGVDGRNLVTLSSNLATGNNAFQLSLTPGAYILKVDGNGYTYAQRVISQSQSTVKPYLSFIDNQTPTNAQPLKAKNFSNVTTMLYASGDQLLFKGISGNYATIVADKPTESKTIDFYFVDCKDVDNNYYPVVIIGTQTWMVENLKTTKYRDGSSIANVPDWADLSTGAWCDYDNMEANGTKYGHLYNWYAVTDSLNIAPVGWHVPSVAEWTTLTNYVAANLGTSLNVAKALATTTDWAASTIAGEVGNNLALNNSTGFSALPSGIFVGNGSFFGVGNCSYLWSSNEFNAENAWYNGMYGLNYVDKSYDSKVRGYSVRCVRDNVPTLSSTTAVTAIKSTTAISGGNITSDGGVAIIARGICWSTSAAPTTALSTKTTETGTTGTFYSSMTGLTANTKYYVRAYATYIAGSCYGNEVSFTTLAPPVGITDIDGNVYTYITIGTQTWMVENLKTTKYRDGSPIANVTDETLWGGLSTGAWCDYANNPANGAKYGHLYNWHAATDSLNIAPLGWHVPTDAEWTTLINYVAANLGTSLNVTKALAATTDWNTHSNAGAVGNNLFLNNSTDFSALPGGVRSYEGTFDLIGNYGKWWSTSSYDEVMVWYMFMAYDNNTIFRSYTQKMFGFSVRCIKD